MLAFYRGYENGEHNLTRREALEICLRMQGAANVDGVGSGHINENGELCIRKHKDSLMDVLKNGISKKDTSFLSHLDNPDWRGWTTVHLRAASIGEISVNNAHPFNIENKWIFQHNGTAASYENKILRLAMSKTVKFQGDTDSETLGHLLNISGAREFAEVVKTTGVFFALRKDGSLYVIKTSGSLDICTRGDSHFFASDIDFQKYPESSVIKENGWFYLGKDGKMLSSKEIKSSYSGVTTYQGQGTNSNYYSHRGMGQYSLGD